MWEWNGHLAVFNSTYLLVSEKGHLDCFVDSIFFFLPEKIVCLKFQVTFSCIEFWKFPTLGDRFRAPNSLPKVNQTLCSNKL